MRPLTGVLLLALVACAGGTKQPDFPDLHPVTGVVKKDGKAVTGGSVRFTPDPDRPEFLVNAEVGDDGTFRLSTVRTTDKQGERKPGAAAGKYKVTYSPAAGDQTAGPVGVPIDAATPVEVKPGENGLVIELPKR